MPPPAARQLALPLEAPADFRREDFVTGAANAEARARLDAWRDWPKGALALTGPAGTGKSHLAAVWAHEAGAVRLDPATPTAAFPPPGAPVCVEDADRGAADATLFHLLNRAAHGEGSLLLTARAPPLAWPCALPDLRSRLNALACAELDEPDDALFLALLARAFARRTVSPSDELLRYLIRRVERSAAAAAAIAARLDAEAAGGRVGLALARRVLEDDADDARD